VVFAISFLGALFAILVSLLLVYSWVTLRLIPHLKKSFRALVGEVGAKAIFERAGVSPERAMQDVGLDPTAAAVAAIRARDNEPSTAPIRVVFTCEDHGRCVGCPRVLAQFEAIIRHQGENTFDEVERRCYAQLREQIASDTLLDGESETSRQRRIAARVVETLVREGFSENAAREAVWSRSKDVRATFADWLLAARAGCRRRTAHGAGDIAS
jgi:hypothetical protein